MFKRKTIIFTVFFLALCTSFSFADTDTFNTTNFVNQLNVLYQKGQSREQIGAHEAAVAIYKDIISKTLAVVDDPHRSQETVTSILPFTIGAGYRLGLITQRVNDGSAEKLYDKLQSYKETQDAIENILTTIANLQIDRDYRLPHRQYNHLYYARSFNRISWAATLINGNLWKNYFIYMPADTVALINISIDELKKMFENYGVQNYENIAVTDAQMDAFGRQLQNDATAAERLTFKLSFYSPRLEQTNQIMKQEIGHHTRDLLLLYKTSAIQNGLNQAHNFQSIEAYVGEEGRPLFNAINEIQKALGQRNF